MNTAKRLVFLYYLNTYKSLIEFLITGKLRFETNFTNFPIIEKILFFLDKFHHQFQFIRQSVLNHVPRAPLCPMCLWSVSTFIYSRAFIFYVNYEPSFFRVLTLYMLIKITQINNLPMIVHLRYY